MVPSVAGRLIVQEGAVDGVLLSFFFRPPGSDLMNDFAALLLGRSCGTWMFLCLFPRTSVQGYFRSCLGHEVFSLCTTAVIR